MLLERIELSASPLPRVRSTTELQQPTEARAIVGSAANVKRGLKALRDSAKGLRMSEETNNNLSREERLAAKLRENLRRRKAQSRAQNQAMKSESPENGLSNQGGES